MIKTLLTSIAVLMSSSVWAEPAPNWQLPSLLDESTVSLEQLRGQIVVLDFWASWCVPCRPAMAALQQLQRDYADAPVRVVPISVDENSEDAAAFLQRYGQGLNSLHDAQGKVAEAYALLGMPSSFVIGPDGQIALRHEGFRKGDDAHWRKVIDQLLKPGRKPA